MLRRQALIATPPPTISAANTNSPPRSRLRSSPHGTEESTHTTFPTSPGDCTLPVLSTPPLLQGPSTPMIMEFRPLTDSSNTTRNCALSRLFRYGPTCWRICQTVSRGISRPACCSCWFSRAFTIHLSRELTTPFSCTAGCD